MAVKEKKIARAAVPAELPEGWRVMRFDEMAQLVNDRVDNPSEAGVERYVGLEHLDPESLKIRRWGSPDDVEAQKLRFQPGDIIFGKRRAYQRKLAVADFEGICSAHAMVLRAREETVVKEFLPFFMQSDTFFERALSISVGSLSPTINWKTLASQEFTIPPKNEQHRIADILWAADDTITAAQDVLGQIDSLSNLLLEKTLKGQNWQKVSLGDLLLDIQYGLSKRAGEKIKDSVPILRIPNVVKNGIDLSDLAWIVLPEEEKQKYAIRRGDVLIVRTNGNPDYVGRSIVIDEMPEELVYASYLIRLRVDEDRVLPDYVNTLLGSNYLRSTLRHEIRSSAGNYNLNTVGIKRQQIPLPSIDEQDNLLKQLALLKSGKAKFESHTKQSINLKKSLLSKLLMPHPKEH